MTGMGVMTIAGLDNSQRLKRLREESRTYSIEMLKRRRMAQKAVNRRLTLFGKGR